MASNIKVDIVRPTATNGSLSLKGDSSGSATANGITVDSSGNTSITGTTTISSADINGGTIDGVTLGTASAVTEAQVDNININGNTISSTDTDGDINLTPDGNGSAVVTSAGTGDALRITQTGTGNALVVEDSANPDSTPFVVDASGNVGIGTTAADEKVQTEGGSYLASNGSNASTTTVGFKTGRRRTGGASVVGNDELGFYKFQGHDGANYIEAASITAAVDGTPGTNDMPGRLVFSTTADGASSPTERMRIDSSGNLKFDSGYGSVATAYGCRAWVNFNGTGTVAIRASGNVSSITDNGTGDYTVNFTTAMPDANYAVNLTSRITGTGISPVVINLLTTTTPTASLFRVICDRSGVGPTDPEYVFASVFR